MLCHTVVERTVPWPFTRCWNVMPMELLGKFLDEEAILVMKSAGIDICGENGEYHTLTIDGPVFQKPLVFQIGDKIEIGDYAVVDIR